MKKRIFQKGLGYGIFLIVPIVLYLVLFFNGVIVSDDDRMIEFEISSEIRKQDE